MESLHWAIDHVTAEMERLQPELERLEQERERLKQELERLKQQHAMLLGAKEVIRQLSGATDTVGQQRYPADPELQESIIDASAKILLAHGRDMSPAEIRAELEKVGRPVHYNVLSSELSREVSEENPTPRIRRVAPGRYIAVVPDGLPAQEETEEAKSEAGLFQQSVPRQNADSEQRTQPSEQAVE